MSEQYLNEVIMLASSNFIFPQKVYIEILLQFDQGGLSATPAYFGQDVTKFFTNRKLIALESYYDQDIGFSPNNPSVPVIGILQFRALSLTLLREPGNGVEGGDFYKNVPLGQFRRLLSPTTANPAPGIPMDLFRVEPVNISWQDSFVQSGPPLSAQTKTLAVPFVATYLLEEQDPAPYRLIKLRNAR